jgi:hypothetical protein
MSKSSKRKNKKARTVPTRQMKEKRGFNLSILQVAGILLLLSLIYFYKVLTPNSMVIGTDEVTAQYFVNDFQAQMLKTHFLFPLWNSYLFGGLPYIDALHGEMFYLTPLLSVGVHCFSV